MDLKSYYSNATGTDQYDRKYPVTIKFINGRIVVGHIFVFEKSRNENGEIVTKNINLKVINNLEDWKSNKISMGDETIAFDDNEIETISVFTDY